VAGITNNSWAVFELPTKQFTAFRVNAAAESSQAGFGLSAKATGLKRLSLRTAQPESRMVSLCGDSIETVVA